LCAENNLRVANCSTPAQYFHLLRRQALLSEARPLVVMTPKSLLRHPRAVSTFDELAGGTFHRLLDDGSATARADDVRRVLLCSGKVYYDLLAAAEKTSTDSHVIVRVEQLYPLHVPELEQILAAYPNAGELVWVQEEPENSGAWRYVHRYLEAAAGERNVRYVGRPERASPAEGYASDHEREQQRIVGEALADIPAKRTRRGGTKKASR
jgi:2-oxoglutarate dehydrogenase E1 component